MSLDQLFSQDASGAIMVSVSYKPIFRLFEQAIQTTHQLRRLHQLCVSVASELCLLIIYDVPISGCHWDITNLTRHLKLILTVVVWLLTHIYNMSRTAPLKISPWALFNWESDNQLQTKHENVSSHRGSGFA